MTARAQDLAAAREHEIHQRMRKARFAAARPSAQDGDPRVPRLYVDPISAKSAELLVTADEGHRRGGRSRVPVARGLERARADFVDVLEVVTKSGGRRVPMIRIARQKPL